jgi:hypothetical protein
MADIVIIIHYFLKILIIPDGNTCHAQDLIADVKGIVEDWVVPLAPARDPETSKEFHQSQRALTIALAKSKSNSSRMSDLLSKTMNLLLTKRRSKCLRRLKIARLLRQNGELAGQARQRYVWRMGRVGGWGRC